ncbi:hypothetical protein ABPG77_006109 [Micractinium sp. CCAP 211/92]
MPRLQRAVRERQPGSPQQSSEQPSPQQQQQQQQQQQHPAAAAPSTAPSAAPLARRPKGAGALLDGPPAKAPSRKASLEAVARAQVQVQQLFPRLPPVLQAWLLHRLLARFAKVPEADLWEGSTPVVIPLVNAVSAANSIAYGPASQVAEVAAGLLAQLQQRFLDGAELLGPAAANICGASDTLPNSGKPRPGVKLLEGLSDADALAQAVMELLAHPSLAAPRLLAGSEQGGDAGRRSLPPPPPPPQRGSVVPAPEPLQRLFPGGAGAGKGATGVLQQLLSQALERLDASCALGAGQPGSGGQQLPLHVSPDIDFGTVAVSRLAGEHLLQAAHSVAAGLPSSGNTAHSYAATAGAASHAGSLLDLLHLASQEQRPRCQAGSLQSSGAATAADSGAGNTNSDVAPGSPAGSVLHFRQLAVENTSPSDTLWLLGGIAAPAFPHTLAAVDDARLFWLEGHRAVRLGPLQQHTVGVALSSADCAARRQERGVLQQLLLLVFAAPLRSRLAQQLGELQGVPCADVPAREVGSSGGSAAADAAMELASEAATAAATADAPEACAPAASYRLFVVARRVTVALVDSPAELASLLDSEARPYIPEHLRRLFDTPPDKPTTMLGFPAHAPRLLATGVPDPGRTGLGSQLLQVPAAHQQKGRARMRSLPPEAAGARAGRLLQRYGRLLALEEAAMEQDICSFDMWNVRLRLAAFSSASNTRYRLVSFGPQPTGSAGEEQQRQRAGRLYKGPAVNLLQPGGIGGAAGRDGLVYALGVLEVPGLPEGRPTLLMGDTVHLRLAQLPQREVPTLVAATDGSTAFLLLAPGFWIMPEVQPLLPQLARAQHLGGSGLFDGLIHVRFGFDRLALHRMHGALAQAAEKQLLAHACWLPPGEALGSLSGGKCDDSGGGNVSDGTHAGPALPTAELRRLEQLQPEAEVVAKVAGTMRERGSQRPLNAEQRQAIAAVVCGAGRAMPYALFGPPGTGKTVTLVECALQLLETYDHARLLLCAPQNYSADLLCSSLAAAGLGPEEVLRLNDPRRPAFTAKEDVLPFCTFSEASRMFTLPTRAEVEARRVVVATCCAAALIQEGEFEGCPCSFTHVLIDEAGQALLPEALVPLGLLAPPPAVATLEAAAAQPGWGAVLCGDPRQLGPIVRSKAAAAAGLAASLLELCVSHHSAVAFQVLRMGRTPATSMLVRNYRSHRRLLDLPSRLFYQGSLVAAADQRLVLPPKWGELRGDEAEAAGEAPPGEGAVAGGDEGTQEDAAAVGEAEEDGDLEDGQEEEEEDYQGEEEGEATPSLASLLFYGVRGRQMREGEAPSWFNPVEASVVVELVRGLLAAAPGLLPTDIGVMAPFRKQVQKIRLLLRQRGLGAIRCGTVDDYQGQEERCIFISTTLSKPESVAPSQPGHAAAAGVHAHLGFWGAPRRFNVAVTRAKALLVVVGHPAVLLEDPSWRELLRYCLSVGAFRGAGSETIRQRFLFDPGATAPELRQEGAAPELEDAELQRAIGQLAELALLGAGQARRLFPDPSQLDELYESAMEDAPFRVAL